MNTDYKILSEKYNSVLKEWSPVYSGDYDPAGTATKINTIKQPMEKGQPAPRGYQIGKTAQQTGRDLVDMVTQILDRVKKNVFTAEPHSVGGRQYDLYYPGDPEEFKEEVKKIIVDVCNLPQSAANTAAGHAARVIMNDIIGVLPIKSRESAGVRTSTIKIKRASHDSAILDALGEVIKAPEVAPKAVETEADIAIPRVSAITRGAQWSLSNTYYIEDEVPDNAFNKIANRERKMEAKIARHRMISNVGKGATIKGADLINKLEMPWDTATKAVKDLLAIGAITEDSGEDENDERHIPVLDKPDEDERHDDVFSDLERQTMGGKTDVRGSYE